jgi:bifunctional aspartokinase / homoserine dehydrogenase 2
MSQSNLAVQVSAQAHNLSQHRAQVHKFGGSSLASVAAILRVLEIIAKHCRLHDLVVVSANGDTTDRLIKIYHQALEHAPALANAIESLKRYQSDLITGLLTESNAAPLLSQLAADCEQLAVIAQAGAQNEPAIAYSNCLAFGELWSSRLLAAVLAERVCPAQAIDARDFLVVNNAEQAQLVYALSQKQLTLLLPTQQLAVITGFIAKDQQGHTCTLGRNGSDYSATIVAALSQASQVTLWTDVDGIYSADPRIVPNARKLHRLPTQVAQELGRLGNPVLHAKTMQPLEQHKTHLTVASSFAKQHQGTEIGEFGQIAQQQLSVTYLNDVLLAQAKSINSQHQAQLNALCAPLYADYQQGYLVITQSQQKALSQFLASSAEELIFTPISLVAVVGYQVAQRANIRAKFKRAVTDLRPLAIVATEPQHSLIALITQTCSAELVNQIHAKVTQNTRTIGLVVAGLGNIGQRFLAMLPEQITRIAALEQVHLVGLLNSKRALFAEDGLALSQLVEQFEQAALPYSEADLLHWLSQHPYDELILVDITPSEQFSAWYGKFFARGIHVLGANKWAASSATPVFNELVHSAKQHQCLWLGNTTVGAGLPINYALQDLSNSGDQIQQISGIFSGTLSWLFHQFNDELSFSALLRSALKQGITEPDPRDDLSGRDVQRKLLILARAAGFSLSLADIACQNLVPASLRALTKTEFLARAHELDLFFSEQLLLAKASGKKLRYIARFSAQGARLKASVGLAMLAHDHPFSTISAGDNIFQLHSRWYQKNPLIIQGPGAGREVTAGGLHSDLVNLCQQLVLRQPQVTIEGISA